MNSACVLFFVAGIIMLVFGIAGRAIKVAGIFTPFTKM